jgi:hypothetical protein
MFRYASEADASTQLKLKVEINTREHICLLGYKSYPWTRARGESRADQTFDGLRMNGTGLE